MDRSRTSFDVTWARDSLLRVSGRDLYAGLDLEHGPNEALKRAPFALLAHDTAPDPVFVYGNDRALALFDTTWDELTAMSSRLSAEPDDRDERADLLARVERTGWTDGYRGVRVSRRGRRFLVEDALVWNVLDPEGRLVGQAACLPRWTYLDDGAAFGGASEGVGHADPVAPSDAGGPGGGTALLQRERVRTTLTLTSPTTSEVAVALDSTVPPVVRPLSREELDLALTWDAEGPDPLDAQALWDADPTALWGVELDGVLVAAGSAAAHQGQLGRIGFVVVQPAMRRHGIGQVTVQFLVDDLLGRLAPGAAVVLDATPEVSDHVERLGFQPQGRVLRLRGPATAGRRGPHTGEIRALRMIPFERVVGYDTLHTGVLREALLTDWIARPGAVALGVFERGEVLGLAVARPVRDGHAIGPFYATEPDVAQDLLVALAGQLQGSTLTVDVPEANGVGVGLARAYGLAPVGSRTTMALGDPPVLPVDSIYGITSFELG